jgi:hypothetical protein
MSPEHEALAWLDELPAVRPRNIPLWSPKPGAPVKVVVLSERVELVEVHHTPLGSCPCHSDRSKCRLCLKGNSDIRTKGYVSAWSNEKGREVIVELTDDAMQKCRHLRENRPLRGHTITLTRLGEAPNSRVAAKVSDTASALPLPSSCNVREHMARLWFAPRKGRSEEGTADG